MSTIYLMRHSRAVSADSRTSDEARWLTESGREMAAAVGAALAERGTIDCIVTSPLVRAVQSAEIVAACLNWRGEIRTMDSLCSESPAQRALEDLQALACRSLLAVTHEPIVSTMSALLSGKSGSEFRSAFQTAEVRAFHGDNLVFRHQP